jgi:hypothetical protein
VRKADNLPPSCAVVTKFGNLNFLEPSGPVQACNGTDLPLPFFFLLYLYLKYNIYFSLEFQHLTTWNRSHNACRNNKCSEVLSGPERYIEIYKRCEGFLFVLCVTAFILVTLTTRYLLLEIIVELRL